jgi:hypothetical protein
MSFSDVIDVNVKISCSLKTVLVPWSVSMDHALHIYVTVSHKRNKKIVKIKAHLKQQKKKKTRDTCKKKLSLLLIDVTLNTPYYNNRQSLCVKTTSYDYEWR